MSYSTRQKAIAKAIVAVFEGGSSRGKYNAFVVLRDGAGISYGAHQATHGGGSLYKIVKKYTQISNSVEARALRAYLPILSRTGKNAKSVIAASKDAQLKKLLVNAAADPQMKFAQDSVIDAVYLDPAVEACEGSGWTTTLALAVVFDSMVHGSWKMIRDRIKGSLSEKAWIKAYVQARKNWLSTTRVNPVLKKTVYRPNTFLALIAANNWDCKPPFTVQGRKITEADIAYHKEILDAGEEVESNFIRATSLSQPVIDPDEYESVEEIPMPEPVEEQDDNPEHTSPEDAEDGYPNEPKPGEEVPDAPAEPGAPVVGGRPTDEPVAVEATPTESISGWKTWPTTVMATLSGVGVSAGSLLSWWWGAVQDPNSANFVLALTIAGLVISALFGIVYLITRAVGTASEKARKHEIDVLKLKSQMDPRLYNVEFVESTPPPPRGFFNSITGG